MLKWPNYCIFQDKGLCCDIKASCETHSWSSLTLKSSDLRHSPLPQPTSTNIILFKLYILDAFDLDLRHLQPPLRPQHHLHRHPGPVVRLQVNLQRVQLVQQHLHPPFRLQHHLQRPQRGQQRPRLQQGLQQRHYGYSTSLRDEM